jgi:HAE1 family hydrophobic/amphiphilic exporter-1
LLLIYLVLVAIFQSFKTPFIMLITVPLAFTGGFLLLWIFGMPISMPAMIGLLILMAVIINNGIVLIDYVNQARRDGLGVHDALISATTIRTRPILMTAISTVFAMIPLAMGLGSGGAMMQPMAVLTIGGLLYGTLMTLLVAPAFYAIFNREKKQKLLGTQECLPPAEILSLPAPAAPETTTKKKRPKKQDEK